MQKKKISGTFKSSITNKSTFECALINNTVEVHGLICTTRLGSTMTLNYNPK